MKSAKEICWPLCGVGVRGTCVANCVAVAPRAAPGLAGGHGLVGHFLHGAAGDACTGVVEDDGMRKRRWLEPLDRCPEHHGERDPDLFNGLPPGSMFKPFLEVTVLDESTVQVDALGSAVFSNWIPFRRQIRQLGLDQQNSIIVNLEGTKLVDHSVMEGLHQLQSDFVRAGLTLDIVGLDSHHALSKHPFATRRRRA